MKLSVVVCTYNRDRYIYECLSCLVKNKFQGEWELLLVDNNSTDNTKNECERFVVDYTPSNYRYIKETNQGLSYARNRGIAESSGDWVVFLDDDAYVSESYLSTLSYWLTRYPEAGAFGGAIEPVFEDIEPKWINPWSLSFVSALNLGDEPCLFEANKYPIGANMGISRATIDLVGVFNTSLGRTGDNLLGGEEKDMFSRIRQLNIPIVYFPNIKVEHCIPPKRTTKEFIAKMGYGIGISERLRTRKLGGFSYVKRICAEFVKWGGTMVIWFYYVIRGHYPKGEILVLFRYNVSKGLLLGEK